MDFSTLAIQKLLELMPELASFVVSFNDLSDELPSEDTNAKVGVLVIQFGSTFSYIPVVAVGDMIQPFDSIFLHDEAQFRPLTKTLVRELAANMTAEPGTPDRLSRTATINPSVYDLVVPPRTGKFVYASSSRLTEFLASMPNGVKEGVLEKIASDQRLYQHVHDLFNLPDVLTALKHRTVTKHEVRMGNEGVKVITDGENLGDEIIQEIMHKGYALRGEHQTNRIAINVLDATHSRKLQTLANGDSGKDVEIVLKNGQTAVGFFPKKAVVAKGEQPSLLIPNRDQSTGKSFGLSGEQCFVMLSDGSYVQTHQIVTVGTPIDGFGTFKQLSETGLVSKISDIRNYDHFALLTPNLDIIGVYRADDVAISSSGITIRVSGGIIQAIPGLKTTDTSIPKKILVPTNAVVVVLGKNRSGDVEDNLTAAAASMEMRFMETLGSYSNLGFDGCEFSYNGARVGPEVKVMEILVVKEGISPTKADEFVKQAKDYGHVKFFMSKEASFDSQDSIPSYGEPGLPQEDMWGLPSESVDNMAHAMGTNDAQVAETAIITELLQAPSMTEYISEYLPDIELCLDRLGRIIFLSRVNYDKLSTSLNATEVLSFVNNLRNVYKSLGDSYIKLRSLTVVSSETESDS